MVKQNHRFAKKKKVMIIVRYTSIASGKLIGSITEPAQKKKCALCNSLLRWIYDRKWPPQENKPIEKKAARAPDADRLPEARPRSWVFGKRTHEWGLTRCL